jgi:hypothetical protein
MPLLKSTENRLRCMARSQDLILCKSRTRTPSIDNEGGYMLIDLYNNFPVAGYTYDLDLEDVAEYLAS